MSMSHKASNLALHNRVCSIPEGGTLFSFDKGLHGVDSAGNIIQPLDGAVATLRSGEGRFGGAVAAEEGTENLVTNPKTWKPSSSQYQTTTETGKMFLGCTVSETVKLSNGTPTSNLRRVTIAPGETYTASIYVKQINHTQGEGARLIFYNDTTLASTRAVSGIKGWQRLGVTYTNNTESDVTSNAYYYPAQIAGSITQQAAPQVEKKPFATSFVDGSRGNGTVDIPVQYTNSGTISFWVKLPYSLPAEFGSNDIMMSTAHDGDYGGSSSLNFRRSGSSYGGRLLGIHWVGNDGSSNHFSPTWNEGRLYHQADWNLYTITWTANRYDFYINSVRMGGSSSSSGLKPFESNRLRIRGYYSLYDELLILPYAATDEEIQSWYHSNSRIHNNADAYITL